MNDLSNNKYIARYKDDWNSISVSDYITYDMALERPASRDEMFCAINDLLALLGFKIQLLGFKYLAKLVEWYLLDDKYEELPSIAHLARLYGVEEDFITGNIEDAISLVKDLSYKFGTYLHCPTEECPSKTITDVVEAIGAMFVIYFNYTVVGEPEPESENCINFGRFVING